MEVNITRVVMCENLIEKMTVEEQEVMEECKSETDISLGRHGGRPEKGERGRAMDGTGDGGGRRQTER